MQEAQEYIGVVHGDSQGWITIANMADQRYHQWHYKALELVQMEFDKENMYMSQNTFYKPQRRIENIKELRTLFIDLDLYKYNMTKEQAIYWLKEDYFNVKVPRPNLIVDSGRGLYLIWTIETVPAKALSLWKAIEEHFYKTLKELGADRQALDPTRVLRIPTTINSKSKTAVKILERYQYLYTLREIQGEYLPELVPHTEQKKKGRPTKVYAIYRDRSLYQARILDLIKICELRKYDVRGHREVLLFLYRYYICYFTEDTAKALEDTLELNSEFREPLVRSQAVTATRSAERVFLQKDKQYKYKNETLIDLLEITEEEQTHLLTIIGKSEYKSRHNKREKKRYAENKEVVKEKYVEKLKEEGKMTKKEELDILRQKIKDLKGKGLSNKVIAIDLGIPIKTLERHITFMKKHKLLA